MFIIFFANLIKFKILINDKTIMKSLGGGGGGTGSSKIGSLKLQDGILW